MMLKINEIKPVPDCEFCHGTGTVKQIDPMEEQARGIALCLVESEDADVTAEMVESWHQWDVYEWVASFGYMWDEEEQVWILDEVED